MEDCIALQRLEAKLTAMKETFQSYNGNDYSCASDYPRGLNDGMSIVATEAEKWVDECLGVLKEKTAHEAATR